MSMIALKPAARSRVEDKLEFQLIFAVALLLCLVAATVELIAPRSWRAGAATVQPGQSFFKGAVASARTAAKFAFMG